MNFELFLETNSIVLDQIHASVLLLLISVLYHKHVVVHLNISRKNGMKRGLKLLFNFKVLRHLLLSI